MITNALKWASIATLVIITVALAWRQVTGTAWRIVVFVVAADAILVAVETFRGGKYLWSVLFAAIMLIVNPLVPVGLPTHTSVSVNGLASLAFAASLIWLRATTQLPVLSIINIPARDRAL